MLEGNEDDLEGNVQTLSNEAKLSGQLANIISRTQRQCYFDKKILEERLNCIEFIRKCEKIYIS